MIEKIVSQAKAAAGTSWNLSITPLGNGNGTISDVPTLITAVIHILSLVAGAAAVIYLFWSGFMYITAAGNEKNAETGQKGIVWAVIGIVICTAAYIVASAVFSTSSRFLNGGV